MPKRLKLSINMSQDCHNRGQAFLNPVKLQCHIVKNTLLQTAFTDCFFSEFAHWERRLRKSQVFDNPKQCKFCSNGGLAITKSL